MEQFKQLHDGSLYLPGEETLLAQQLKRLDLVHEYNNLPPSQLARKRELLLQMFAEIGENCYVETPFHSSWGGMHVHFGRNVYTNYNLMLVDDTHIYVGDYTMIGPNVTLATAGHPIDPDLRRRGYQYNAPIRIGANCWIGAGVVILPGITIGDNTVIGAGSIVTREIPSDVVAMGNPCRVLRPIGDRDKAFYFKDLRIDPSIK